MSIEGDTDEGGPVFPQRYGSPETYPGITLREYFAAQAMLIVAGQDLGWDIIRKKADRIAQLAYVLADAMLRERARNMPRLELLPAEELDDEFGGD